MLTKFVVFLCLPVSSLSSDAPLAPVLNCTVAHTQINAGAPGMREGGLFNFDIYSPQGDENCKAGQYPVIFFVTGFGGNVPVTTYSDLLTMVAQRGFIIIGLHHFGSPNYPHEGQMLLDTMEWAQVGNLSALMMQQNLAAKPDVLGRTAVMAQSAGNHVVGEALVINCSVAKAFVMIDPVDGVDPYGIVKGQNLIVPGKMLNFNMPGLLLDNGLDPKQLNMFYPACAPAALSNDRFYKAWPGPIWNVNATAYGHVDCLNDIHGIQHLICPSSKTADKRKYREMLANAAVTFLSSLFEGKPEQISALANASQFSVDVVLKHDMKGLQYSQVKPGCINSRVQDESAGFEVFT